ncbi:hypothetical protein PMIN03_005727 [Paraphaeosphaeria minitans]
MVHGNTEEPRSVYALSIPSVTVVNKTPPFSFMSFPKSSRDETVAVLDDWAAGTERQCAYTLESKQNFGPFDRAFANGLVAILKDDVKNMLRQKDCSLGLRIAIEAETRKPAPEQNAKLLAGYRDNQKTLETQMCVSRLDRFARMQAHGGCIPGLNEETDEIMGNEDQELKESIAAYRWATGI